MKLSPFCILSGSAYLLEQKPQSLWRAVHWDSIGPCWLLPSPGNRCYPLNPGYGKRGQRGCKLDVNSRSARIALLYRAKRGYPDGGLGASVTGIIRSLDYDRRI